MLATMLINSHTYKMKNDSKSRISIQISSISGFHGGLLPNCQSHQAFFVNIMTKKLTLQEAMKQKFNIAVIKKTSARCKKSPQKHLK